MSTPNSSLSPVFQDEDNEPNHEGGPVNLNSQSNKSFDDDEKHKLGG